MKDTEFASASGTLRVMEKRMLTSQSIERVIDASSGPEAMRVLSQNSDYDFGAVETDQNFEPTLRAKLRDLYQTAYSLCPDERIVDLLCAKYDFHNLKVAAKAQHAKLDMEALMLPLSKTAPKTISQLLIDPKAVFFAPQHLIRAAADVNERFAEHFDPQSLDILLDRALFAHLSELSDEIGNEMIARYVKALIDLYNVKALLRVKNMQKGPRLLASVLAPGGVVDPSDVAALYDRPVETIGDALHFKYFGTMLLAAIESYEKTGNFAAFERAADNLLLDIVRQAKYVAFGPETVFAYIVAKENEIRQVRILLTCKANHIKDDVIRERLRDNYA